MKILVTGKGSAGSWQIRGVQLGHAIGARVQPMASPSLIARHDVVVLVKRAPGDLIEALKASGKPVVYDAVDCWKQPDGNGMDRGEARAWLKDRLATIRPTAAIFSSRAMQADAGFTGPSLVLHHHARPGQRLHEPRSRVRYVGYEGRPEYLAEWRPALEAACLRRGWNFTVNPPNLADIDIGVAMRGGEWDGYAPRHWKSNVKLANFQAVGLPCVLLPEAAYIETMSGGERWVESPGDIDAAFDALAEVTERQRAQSTLTTVARAVALPEIARQLRCFLAGLL